MTNIQAKPCPFCGDVPEFKGKPEERDSRRAFVYRLPCECHNIEICVCGWSVWKQHNGYSISDYHGSSNWDWAVELATKNWNESFIKY